MSAQDELMIPSAATQDNESFELLRVWVADKSQHVSLRSGVWKDPAAWGVMLADLAGHVANAYHQDAGLDPTETLQRIVTFLKKELQKPTDRPAGNLR